MAKKALPPVPNNPRGEAFKSFRCDGTKYVVVTGCVPVVEINEDGDVVRGVDIAHHYDNRLLTARDFGPAANIQRLLDRGVLRRATPDDMEEAAAPEPEPETVPAPADAPVVNMPVVNMPVVNMPVVKKPAK